MAQITIAGVLPLMVVAVLVTRKTGKLQVAAVVLLAYLAIVALAMSGNIKHLSVIGFTHALIAFAIAALAASHLGVRAAGCFWSHSFFIVVVGLFNIANENIGLELIGAGTIRVAKL